MPKLIIVAGPTASGKSALAMALAERHDGLIINADSMQCYAELRILTARPSPRDEARFAHRLYGVLPATTPGNAGWWRRAALAVLDEARTAGQTPILCGGTGMYLQALLHGIADIPDPGAKARLEARTYLAEHGPAGLHRKLTALDPGSASSIRPSDGQRLARAYEVLLGTGQSLAFWQARPVEKLVGWRPKLVLLDPPREALRKTAEIRLEKMLQAGALQELAALLALRLDSALPLMRALGVPELTLYLLGQASLAQAAARAAHATHQYSKRQATWFRHRKLVDSPAMQTIHSQITDTAQLSESFLAELDNLINYPG